MGTMPEATSKPRLKTDERRTHFLRIRFDAATEQAVQAACGPMTFPMWARGIIERILRGDVPIAPPYGTVTATDLMRLRVSPDDLRRLQEFIDAKAPEANRNVSRWVSARLAAAARTGVAPAVAA
jgi:hypothetical protein